MSYSSEIRNMFAGKEGIKILNIGPLGPELSEKETKKWLNYMPNFQLDRINYLSSKVAGELTSGEIYELNRLRKDIKMASISKKYGNEKISKRDALAYINYTKQKNLDYIIQKKLTKEEYTSAKEEVHQLLNNLSYEELLKYCDEQKRIYNELSMRDSFVLREVLKVLNRKIRRKEEQILSAALEKNRNKRVRSIEN